MQQSITQASIDKKTCRQSNQHIKINKTVSSKSIRESNHRHNKKTQNATHEKFLEFSIVTEKKRNLKKTDVEKEKEIVRKRQKERQRQKEKESKDGCRSESEIRSCKGIKNTFI